MYSWRRAFTSRSRAICVSRVTRWSLRCRFCFREAKSGGVSLTVLSFVQRHSRRGVWGLVRGVPFSRVRFVCISSFSFAHVVISIASRAHSFLSIHCCAHFTVSFYIKKTKRRLFMCWFVLCGSTSSVISLTYIFVYFVRRRSSLPFLCSFTVRLSISWPLIQHFEDCALSNISPIVVVLFIALQRAFSFCVALRFISLVVCCMPGIISFGRQKIRRRPPSLLSSLLFLHAGAPLSFSFQGKKHGVRSAARLCAFLLSHFVHFCLFSHLSLPHARIRVVNKKTRQKNREKERFRGAVVVASLRALRLSRAAHFGVILRFSHLLSLSPFRQFVLYLFVVCCCRIFSSLFVLYMVCHLSLPLFCTPFLPPSFWAVRSQVRTIAVCLPQTLYVSCCFSLPLHLRLVCCLFGFQRSFLSVVGMGVVLFKRHCCV